RRPHADRALHRRPGPAVPAAAGSDQGAARCRLAGLRPHARSEGRAVTAVAGCGRAHPATGARRELALMRPDFHLVIVGGGLVGACAAALAAADPQLAELRIAVVEANPPVAPPQGEVDLRVSAVSRASQRILAAVGAWGLVPAQFLSPYEDMVV